MLLLRAECAKHGTPHTANVQIFAIFIWLANSQQHLMKGSSSNHCGLIHTGCHSYKHSHVMDSPRTKESIMWWGRD